jgi:hypothetical protein
LMMGSVRCFRQTSRISDLRHGSGRVVPLEKWYNRIGEIFVFSSRK